ncbi:MAG: hypothetical protein RL322_520, partial [Pseudomonadota bacterium]
RWGVKASVGWADTTLLDLVDLFEYRLGAFEIAMPELALELYVDLPDGVNRAAIEPFLPAAFAFNAPGIKLTLLGSDLNLDFGTIEIDTPDEFAHFVSDTVSEADFEDELFALDLNAAHEAFLEREDEAPLEDLEAYELSGDETYVDLTSSDSIERAFAPALQILPSTFTLTDPQLIGQFLGIDVDLTLAVADLDETFVEFSLEDLLPGDLYEQLEPFLIDGGDTEPVELVIPTIEFPSVGPAIPGLESLVEVLQVIPSEFRLYDPAVALSVLGLQLSADVPLVDGLKLLAEKLELDFFEYVEAEAPEESYITFNILDVLPDSVADWLGYFIDDGLDADGLPITDADGLPVENFFEIRIPEIDLGDFTPAALEKYIPFAQTAFRLAQPIFARFGIDLPISTMDLAESVAETDESATESDTETDTDPGDTTTDAGNEPPTDVTEETPADGTEETPADGTEETPGDGTDEAPADGTEDPRVWTEAVQTGAGEAARSEVQILDLARVESSVPDEGTVEFTLSLGKRLTTAPIPVLEIGESANEHQVLNLKHRGGDVGEKYVLSFGNRSAEIRFSADPTVDAERIQSALAAWVGKGNVSVRFDPASRVGWNFDIRFAKGAGAKNQPQVTATRVNKSATLLFSSRTVTEGQSAATPDDQAALIERALESTFGTDTFTVIAQEDGTYRIGFEGRYAQANIDQLKPTALAASLSAAITTLEQGGIATGPSYTIALPAADVGAETFDLRVTIDGVAYEAVGLSLGSTASQIRTALSSALSEDGARLDAEGITVSVKPGVESGSFSVSFGGAMDGHSIGSVELGYTPLAEGEAAPEAPAAEEPPPKPAMGVGGAVSLNDIRSHAQAFIRYATIEAGSVSVIATEDAHISAELDVTAEATGGTAPGLAIGGIIATNLIQSRADAFITHSTVTTTEGDVTVEGSNTAHIDASNISAMSSDGKAIGVTLAFNTVGWQAQNVLFSAIDALIGTSIGDANPSEVTAYIESSDVDSAGAIVVNASNDAMIRAQVANETSSSLAPPEPPGADAVAGGAAGAGATGTGTGSAGASPKETSAGFVLASNMVQGGARAFISGDQHTITAQGGGVSAEALDEARIFSNVTLSATTGDETELELATRALVNLFGTTYTDRSGIQELKLGDRVRIGGHAYTQFDRPELVENGQRVLMQSGAGGAEAGALYEYVGDKPIEDVRFEKEDFTDESVWKKVAGDPGLLYILKDQSNGQPVDLALEDYTDTDRWLALDLDTLVEFAAAGASALGGGRGEGTGIGGLVVRNDVRSDVLAYLEGLTVEAAGDVSVLAEKAASIVSTNESTVTVGGTGANVMIATNTVLGDALAWARDTTITALVEAEPADEDLPLDEAADEELPLDEPASETEAAEDPVSEATEGDAESSPPTDDETTAGEALQLEAEADTETEPEALFEEASADETQADDAEDAPADGSLTIRATNDSSIVASTASKVQAKTSVGVVLAFNTIGYAPQNLLANIADSVLGTSFGDRQRASTRAWMDKTSFDVSGGVEVSAQWDGAIEAVVENSALALVVDRPQAGADAKDSAASQASAISVAPVIAMNKIAADTRAAIENALDSSASGDIVIESLSSTTINAEVAASAISVAASTTGSSKAISVGLSLSRNDIDSDVDAFIRAADSVTQATRPTIESTAGEIRIGAWRNASITANGTATAVAIAASPKGGPAVAGGGTLAFNRISGGTDAYAQQVVLAAPGEDEGLGAVTVRAQDGAAINAYLRSVAAAVSIGGQPVKAVALGLSVARNIIGQKAVTVDLDDVLKASDHAGAEGQTLLTELKKGQRVLNDTALLGKEVYEYIGDTATNQDGILLHVQNFGDENLWKLISYAPTVAATRARLDRADVQAAGDLRLRAVSDAEINATVLAGAAAVAASAQGSKSLAAAGVYAENRIYSSTEALIAAPKATPAVIEAASVSVIGDSRASIDAIAGAAALAASLSGAGSGFSASIGLSLAFNSIDADVLANVRGATLTTTEGVVELRARSSGIELMPPLDWADFEEAGLTAEALDAAANAGKATSYVSSEGQTWDYLPGDGPTVVKKGDQFRAADGAIWSYTGTDGEEIDFTEDFDPAGTADWENTDTDTYTVKTGYTVRVDPLHKDGGDAGRVYRFIGTAVDFTTADETVDLETDQIVRVTTNHPESGWVGRVFKYLGESRSIDLSSADFQDQALWKEESHEIEDLALWREDYSNTDRWALAEEFADPETLDTLETLLLDAGLELAEAEVLRPSALYTTADGLYWKYTSDEGEVDLEAGDLVGDVEGETGGVYRYQGPPEGEEGVPVNLAEADFSDEDRWEAVDPEDKLLRKGDTVALEPGYAFGGEPKTVYRYIGKNNQSVNLSMADYSDDTQWEQVKPTLSVSMLERGQVWRIVDAAGQSFNLARDGSALSVLRNNINAVSVAASAAIGLAAGGSGLAFSGAGAVAINTLRGSTDAVIESSTVSAAGDLSVVAVSDSKIAATVAALSAAIAAGSSSGVGASIGISVARNLIGAEGFGLSGADSIATVRALIIDSDIDIEGNLTLLATARQTIDAVVFSGSVAVGLGGGTGLAASGSGVWAENKIGTRVHAGIDRSLQAAQAATGLDDEGNPVNGGRVNTLRAADVGVFASDRSIIDAFAGAASVAAAIGGGTGAALSIGVALARNVIDGVVRAEIASATLDATGRIDVLAVSDAVIDVFSLAASVAIGIGGATGVGISGAGASALNVILGDTFAAIDESTVTAGDDVALAALAQSLIRATIISASVGVGAGGATGVGASIGVSVARNYIGYNPYANEGTPTWLQGVDNPPQIKEGDTVRLSASSGARAGEVYEYIGTEPIERPDADQNGTPEDVFAAQDYADKTKWKQQLSESANQTIASVSGSSVVAERAVESGSGFEPDSEALPLDPADVFVVADNQQSVAARVFAGSVAASVGGSVGVALSGAGGSATNRINSETQAFIRDTVGEGVRADGDITVSAFDLAEIYSSVMAVSVAAAFGTFGGSLSIGVSVADNVIAGAVRAYADRAVVEAEGTLSLLAAARPSIESYSTAVSVAITGAIGLSFAGGGANSYNTITTEVRAGASRSGSTAVDGSISGWSQLHGGQGVVVLADESAALYGEVFAAAASFGLIAAAAAGTVVVHDIGAIVDATISGAEVTAGSESTVDLRAQALQRSMAQSHALAVSSGASVGVSSATTTDRSLVRAGLGDDVTLRAGTVRITGFAEDQIFQRASASSGGLFVGVAGADSSITILGSLVTFIGSRNTILANTVQILAERDQQFDAVSSNLAIGGIASGSGAAMSTLIAGTADVVIGSGSTVDAATVLIQARNKAEKNRWSASEDSLRSTSAGLASLSALTLATEVGSTNRKFGARVSIGEGTAITTQTARSTGGTLRIETLTDINLIDKVRVDGYGGLPLNFGVVDQDAALVSSIDVRGASLRNLSGNLELNTRTDSDLVAAVNVASMGAIAGANANALTSVTADNTITLTDADLLGTDVKLYAGQDRDRVSNLMFSTARTDIAVVSLYGLSIPVVDARIDERNAIRVQGESAVRAIRDIDLYAEEGLGGAKRAKTDGLVTNLAFPIYVFKPDFLGGATSTNVVDIGAQARLEAGVNYRTELQILPLIVGNDRFDTRKLGQSLTTAEKTALGLDAAQRYEYAPLTMNDVAIGVSTGTLVELVPGAFGEGVANATYRYVATAADGPAEANLVLEREDYTDTTRWQRVDANHLLSSTTTSIQVEQGELVRTSSGKWYQRTGNAVTIGAGESFSAGWSELFSMKSDKGLLFAQALSDDFYVVKPQDMPLPQLVYANVANQLFEDRAKVVEWMQSHAGNAEAIARYTALLEQIDAKLLKMGLAEQQGGTVAPRAQFDMLFLRLPTVQASGGGIYVKAGSASQSALAAAVEGGRAIAHGSARINIVNNTPFGLEVNEVGILASGRTELVDKRLETLSAGKVWFQGRQVGSLASATGSSEIRIMQDAYPIELYNLGGDFQIPAAPQDLYVRGRIENADGDLYLTNKEGSINVTGEIRARSVKLSAAGDFNLATDDWYHSGADPTQYLRFNEQFGTRLADPSVNPSYARRTERYGTGDTADARIAALLASIEATGQSAQVFAMGEININARYLNVNGLIQSGVDSIDLTITEDFQPGTSGNFTDAQGNLLPGIVFGGDGFESVDGYFDADRGLILLDPIQPTAGVVNLTGQIVSTGAGRIRVASGYAAVNLVNRSEYKLAVDAIDVSENRVGRISITDSATLKRETFIVQDGRVDRRVFQGVLTTDDGLSTITYTEDAGQARLGLDAATTTLDYQPVEDRYYLWTAGQAKTRTTVKIYEERSFNLIGWDWDWLSPDTQAKYTDTKFTDGQPLRESEVLVVAGGPNSAGLDGGELLLVQYEQKSNPQVELIKDVSLVRDVFTNTLYRWVGDTAKRSFPVIDFSDTRQWAKVADLTGGVRKVDFAKLVDPAFMGNSLVWESTESNKVQYDGRDWKPAKADNRYDSDFANEEIVSDPPVTTGGGWLREKVVTTKTTTTTGLKDFYTYALKADNPIAIQPMLGATQQTINIDSAAGMVLRGSIAYGNARDPATNYDNFTPIALSADALEITGEVVFSGAVPDIKANSDVTVRVKDPRGSLNILATGDVRVEQIDNPRQSSPVKIGQVIAATYSLGGQALSAGELAQVLAGEFIDPASSPSAPIVVKFNDLTVETGHDLTVLATDGILEGAPGQSRIVAETIQLDAGQGLLLMRIDSDVTGSGAGGVAARADGTISLIETEGDLRLIMPDAWDNAVASIDAATLTTDQTTGETTVVLQDVKLEAARGAILDAAFERFAPDPADMAALIAAGQFDDEAAAAAGFGSVAELQARARFPLAPDIMARLLPHAGVAALATGSGPETLNIRAANLSLVSRAGALSGVPVTAVLDAPTALLAQFNPSGERDGLASLPGQVFQNGLTVSDLSQTWQNLNLPDAPAEGEPGPANVDRFPAFAGSVSELPDAMRFVSLELRPDAGKVLRLDELTVSTRHYEVGARYAGIATSADDFATLQVIDLDTVSADETWRFDLGGLRIDAATELRLYAWGMPTEVIDPVTGESVPLTEENAIQWEDITSTALGGSGLQVRGAVLDAPALLALWDPVGEQAADQALVGAAGSAAVSVSALTRTGLSQGLSNTDSLPLFDAVTDTTINRDRHARFTVTPTASQDGGRVLKLTTLEVSTVNYTEAGGARYAALATSLDGFDRLYQIELDPTASSEVWTFDLGLLEIDQATEFRLYAWGMEGSETDYEDLASSAIEGAGGLRLFGYVESAPPVLSDAGIGQATGRITIATPNGDLGALPESQRQLLNRIRPEDILEVGYQRYEYLGEDTTLDLSAEGLFDNVLAWRKIPASSASPADLLASSDGLEDIRTGQCVEDRRAIRTIVVQVRDDLNIAASGMVRAVSEGELVLRAQSDLEIDNGTLSGLSSAGLQSAGFMQVEVEGSIFAVRNPSLTQPLLRSGGDLVLKAEGGANAIGEPTVFGGGIFVTQGFNQPQLELGFDVGPNATIAVQAPGDVRLARASGNILLAGVHAGGDLTLSAYDGSLLASPRSWDAGIVALSGAQVSLQALDAPGSAFDAVTIGTQSSALRIDADQMQARTRTGAQSIIAIDDVNDLTIAGPGWPGRTDTAPAVPGGLRIAYEGRILVRAAGSLQVGDDTQRGLVEMSFDPEGGILLAAEGGDLTIADDILMGSGALSLRAAGEVRQLRTSLISNANSSASGRGSIEVLAGGGFEQESSARIVTAGARAGDIMIDVMDNIVVSSLDAGNPSIPASQAGSIALRAAGGAVLRAPSILVNDTEIESGEDGILIRGAGLAIEAAESAGGVGRRYDPLTTAVDALALRVLGGVAIVNDRALAVDEVAVDATRVNWFGSGGRTAALPAFSLAGISSGVPFGSATVTAEGSVSLRTTDGDLSIRRDILLKGGANFLAEAMDAAADIEVDEDVSIRLEGSLDMPSGSLSMRAGGAIGLQTGSRLAAEGGDIDLQAHAAALTMSDATAIEAGNIRLAAGGTLSLSSLVAEGAVSLIAGGAVEGGALDAQTDAVHIAAQQLRVQAGEGMGTADARLSTQVLQIAAQTAAGDLAISNRGALEIGPLSDLRIARVVHTGLTVSHYDLELSGLQTGADGGVWVDAHGSITVRSDPALDQGVGIRAGEGGIELIARAVLAEDDSVLDTGELLLQADLLAGDWRTAQGGGLIRLVAAGDIRQAAGTLIASGGGDIEIDSGGMLVLGRVWAAPYASRLAERLSDSVTGGDVSLRAQTITRSDYSLTEPAITGDHLDLEAGAIWASLAVAVDSVSGTIESDGLTLSDLESLGATGSLTIEDLQVLG